MEEIIQISVILLIVVGVSLIMRLFKQPLIIGYILSGIVVGPFVLNLVADAETIGTFANFGIALLLFIVGLNLSPKILKEVGGIALVTGFGQIIFTSVIGFLIGIALGLGVVVSIYVAIALTFSSTIIMMKLLSDKDDLESLYGKIARGFLLVQDFVAIFILIIVSSLAGGGGAISNILQVLTKGGIYLLIVAPIAIFILPKFTSFFAKSSEFLFLFALAWGLGLSALFFTAGFSIGVGALIAGVLLSMSPYSFEISAKMKPLRDFFIISFFISLGSMMVFNGMGNLIFAAVIFSAFILIGNPLVVIILMGWLGYSKKVGFNAGLTVAQISEFSLILVALGVGVGHLPIEILSFVTFIGLFTIAGSTYMVMNSEKIYPYFSKYLSVFERKKTKDLKFEKEIPDYILIGENRIGFSIMNYLRKTGKNYLIVDFNPQRVKKLCSKGIKTLFGDVSCSNFLEDANFQKAKMIISTVPDFNTNALIIRKVRETNQKGVIIVVCERVSEAYHLYRAGADYVLVPKFSAGEDLENLLENFDLDKKAYSREMKKQIKKFDERIKF
jgi:Kef-type K+ transport system membrane component KefB/voltage-gated potassium channel Kch